MFFTRLCISNHGEYDNAILDINNESPVMRFQQGIRKDSPPYRKCVWAIGTEVALSFETSILFRCYKDGHDNHNMLCLA